MPTNGAFVINKATPTATLAVTNSPVVYDGSPHAAAVGITVSSVPGSVGNILTGGAATQTNVGTYAVTADFVPTDTTNYNTVAGLSAGNFIIENAPKYSLSVSKTGTGSGTVTSNPAGIACGATCAADFDYNTLVTLMATPATNSFFSGWNGAGCTGTGTCAVTMDAAKSVTASFTLKTYIYLPIVTKEQ